MQMAEKQSLLHELLGKEQEAFCLRSYIADRRSHSTVKKTLSGNKGVAVVLQIPSPIVEAAIRIQKQRSMRSSGFGLFASLLKRFRSRRRGGNRKRSKNSDKTGVAAADEEDSGCKRHASWSVNKHMNLSGSKSSVEEKGGDFVISSGFYISPFILTGDNPAASSLKQRKESREEEEDDDDEKEQTSPVSVLEPPFSDDNVHQNCDLHTNLKSLYRIGRHETKLEVELGIEIQTNDEQKQRLELNDGMAMKVEVKNMIGNVCEMSGIDITKAMNCAVHGGKHGRQVEEIAADIALHIFQLLIEELLL